jgi:single-strand DNA-binding protein
VASRSVNKVVLLGYVGADADTRSTSNGVARTTFSLATNRYWKDADGQAHEEADWHNIVLWRAENLAPYLVKGKQVYVEGRLATRSWEDQDGNRRYTTEVIAAEVILLGGSNGNGSERQAAAAGRGGTDA